MLLCQFFEDQYKTKRLRGKSPETSRLYRVSIRNFSKSLGRQAFVTDLTNDNVSKHIQWMIDQGRAKATANKDRSQLLAIWRFAIRCGLLSDFPDVLPEIEPQRVPRAWMQEDVARLIKAVDSLQYNVGDVPAHLWWRAILDICLDTGERIGAVMQAKQSWLHGGWMLFPAEARKGGKRDRMYQLSDETIASIARLRPYVGESMFPWPYCYTYLWAKFKKILEQAELPSGRRDLFHKLRRTVASVVHAAGMDATEALDHSHRRTTQAYLDPTFKREIQPSQILAAWLRNPPKPKDSRQTG